jgi:membrane associated rhomboid family serine protease
MRDAAVGHQCPECVAEGRRTQRPVRTAFGGGVTGQLGYVTKSLIGLNILVAVIGVAVAGAGATLGGGLFSQASAVHDFGAVFGPTFTVAPGGDVYYQAVPELGTVFTGIDDGAFYRLITAMFIHYGILHLLLNMWALWILGRNLEAALGPLRFLALYLIAGIGGNVAAYLWSPTSLTAGASTSIFGLLAAFFIVLRKLGRDTSVLIPVLVINLVLTFTISGISIAGHLGGLVTGALVAVVLAYAGGPRRTLLQSVGSGGILLLLLLITVARAIPA